VKGYKHTEIKESARASGIILELKLLLIGKYILRLFKKIKKENSNNRLSYKMNKFNKRYNATRKTKMMLIISLTTLLKLKRINELKPVLE
jgi:hypothetical protein